MKLINKIDRGIVTNYIKRIQETNQNLRIPRDIRYLVILYYHGSYESFALPQDQNVVQINEDKTIMTVHQNKAFGNVMIDSSKYCKLFIYYWIFQMLETNGSIFIGIDDGTQDFDPTDTMPMIGATLHWNGHYKYKCITDKKSGVYAGKSGDEIRMEFNVSQGILSFSVNNQPAGYFGSIDLIDKEKYRMSIIADHGTSINLIEFDKVARIS